MFLIYVLTFLVQLLKGSLRCPREDSKFWTQMCQSPSRRCVSPEPAVPLCCLCCLWPWPAHSRRHSPTLCLALHCLGAPGQGPCWAAGDSSAHTPQTLHFTLFPIKVHTHTHTPSQHFHSIHVLGTVLRVLECNTWHLLLVLALHSQCTGFYATVIFLTSILLLHPFQTKLLSSCCFL